MDDVSNTSRECVFNYVSKHLEVCQKYSAICCVSRVFSVFGNTVTQCLLCLVYDMLIAKIFFTTLGQSLHA